ncbi:12830_t:CDS:2 [Cetraspora pellucida]|uniref:12830_t:CDS:1 n=1 Tax=Cetraspora pellucida TaxID=1433469 RepID=A0A9N9NAX0_9GLOM|nr:12830_t:CDS:2 [Cetraspora pellucida]
MFTEQAKELVNLKKRFKSFKLESRLTELTFESFKLREEVYNSLRQGVLKDVEPFLPTEIQALTIPEILKMDNKHILCAAETGSGKTLAYLLPIVNKLKEEEAQSTSYTREEINTEILKVSTEEENQQKYKTLEMPVDIVIATPAGLLEYIDQGYINIADTKYVVIDEADTMFGKGFGEEVQNIINKVKNSGKKQNRANQIIIVSATIPKPVNEMLKREFPNIKKVLKKHYTEEHSTMIFCNTRVSAYALESFLKSKKYSVIGLFGDVEERTTKLEAFRNQEGNSKILVCTDLASRGIDTTFVKHVILYDFPTTVVNFLHRIGRTARAGRKGEATYFITKKNRELASKISKNIKEGRVLA